MSTFAAAAGGDSLGIIVSLKKCTDLPVAGEVARGVGDGGRENGLRFMPVVGGIRS